MSDLMDMLKPQLEGMQEMYRAGYKAGLAEGRRQVFSEMAKDLKEITHV